MCWHACFCSRVHVCVRALTDVSAAVVQGRRLHVSRLPLRTRQGVRHGSQQDARSRPTQTLPRLRERPLGGAAVAGRLRSGRARCDVTRSNELTVFARTLYKKNVVSVFCSFNNASVRWRHTKVPVNELGEQEYLDSATYVG